jgi:hypothetical protein
MLCYIDFSNVDGTMCNNFGGKKKTYHLHICIQMKKLKKDM